MLIFSSSIVEINDTELPEEGRVATKLPLLKKHIICETQESETQ